MQEDLCNFIIRGGRGCVGASKIDEKVPFYDKKCGCYCLALSLPGKYFFLAYQML